MYPRQYLADGTPVLPSDQAIALQASNPAWVEERRRRLADVGWYMKALKETISRRANREDQCSGAFWEGQIKQIKDRHKLS